MKNTTFKSTLRAQAPAFVPNQTKFVSDSNAADSHLPMNFQYWKSRPKNQKETWCKIPNLGKIMVPKKPKKEKPGEALKDLLERQSKGEEGIALRIAALYHERALDCIKNDYNSEAEDFMSKARAQLEIDAKEAEKKMAAELLSAAEALGSIEFNLVIPKPDVALLSPAQIKMSNRDALTMNLLTASSLASQPNATDPIVHSPDKITKPTSVQKLERGQLTPKENLSKVLTIV